MKKLGIVLLALSGCMSATDHAASLHPTREQSISIGMVQGQIHAGMTKSAVAQVLGAPNIVSKDLKGLESWIYDKVASETSYSNSSNAIGGGAAALTGVGSVLLGGIGSISNERNTGAVATSQRTLTVVITFNNAGLVDNSTYHSTTF
jgi:hypothetical protein